MSVQTNQAAAWPAKENFRESVPSSQWNPTGGLATARRVLPLLINKHTFTSGPNLLMMAAFAACSGLFLMVAGGMWAFMQWDTVDDPNGVAGTYKILAGLATALLIVPAFTLGQSAANLSSRRDDERLSSLSLLGASRATVTAVALSGPALLAAMGTVVGVGLYFVLLLPVSHIPFQGHGLGYANMVLPWWELAVAVVVLILVSVASTLVSLRRVVVSPLGVRTRSVAGGFPLKRLVAGGMLLVLVMVAMAMSKAGGVAAVVIGALLFMLMGALVVVDLLGVVFLRILAGFKAKRAATAEQLVAARFVLDEPKRYWRRVSGLAMTAFTANFAGSAASLAQSAVKMDGGTAAGADGARAGEATAAVGAAPPEVLTMFSDMLTGVFLVLGISFVFITISAVLNQAADLYDRADSFVQLRAAGMSTESVRSINVKAVMMPVIWVSVFSACLGLLLVFPLAGAALVMSPVTFVVLLASIVVGVVLVRLGLMLTNPLVARVSAMD